MCIYRVFTDAFLFEKNFSNPTLMFCISGVIAFWEKLPNHRWIGPFGKLTLAAADVDPRRPRSNEGMVGDAHTWILQ